MREDLEIIDLEADNGEQDLRDQNLMEQDLGIEYITFTETDHASGTDEKRENNAGRKERDIKTKKHPLSRMQRIQMAAAAVLTLSLLIGIPVYSWFHWQRELARLERIHAPNVLFVTAAHREDAIYLEMGTIDVNARWRDGLGQDVGQMLYKDYVFCVAGDYVNSYTLQLAHTTNNEYRYEIFEAEVAQPEGIENKDYTIYEMRRDFPAGIPEIEDHDGETGNAGEILYYRIRRDDSDRKISLNAAQVNGESVTKSTYTVGGADISYGGHYLNQNGSTGLALATGDLHDITYDDYNKVEIHSEPLYWQAAGIPGEGAALKAPFYHEYILRVSWNADAPTEYKDTDLICISAKAE